MRFVQAFVSALVGGFVLTLANGAHAQSDTKQGYATIVRIQGEARYSPGNNVWHPLTVGQTLGPGDVIQTAVNSKVDIVLGDKITKHLVGVPNKVAPGPDAGVRGMTSYKAQAEQNVIRLQSDTVLAIDKLLISNSGADGVSDTELDLRQGSIFGNVKKLSAASQYLIKMPNGIAGIRGTTFELGATGSVTVIAGSLVLSHVNGNGQTITAVLGPGDSFNPQTGLVTNLTTGVVTNPLTGQVVAHLTRRQLIEMGFQDLVQLIDRTAQLVTIEQGVITYASDKTIIYVSPTRGTASTQ